MSLSKAISNLPKDLQSHIQPYIGRPIMFCQEFWFYTNDEMVWDEHLEGVYQSMWNYEWTYCENVEEEDAQLIQFCIEHPLQRVYMDSWLWNYVETIYNNPVDEGVIKAVGEQINEMYGFHGMQGVFYYLNRTPMGFNGQTWSNFRCGLNSAWHGVGRWRQ